MEIRTFSLDIPEIVMIEPGLAEDERGYLFEAWNEDQFFTAVGDFGAFVQDNQSRSRRGVVRGLHYQLPNPQGKLVRAIAGSVFSVGVDLRRDSPTFGGWAGAVLSAASRNQLWLPPGFAHGFLALDEGTEILYKMTDYYRPGCERTLRWDDPEIGIDWPLNELTPIVSDRDRLAPALADAAVYD